MTQPGQGGVRISPEMAAQLQAVVSASLDALAMLDNAPFWPDLDAVREEADQAAALLRAALVALGALPAPEKQ